MIDIPERIWYYEISVWGRNNLYPTRQQVLDTFSALADIGALGDSFSHSDVIKALEPYDSSSGLIIEYPVSRMFIDKVLGKFLRSRNPAVKEADMRVGRGSDVTAQMFFFEDDERMMEMRPASDAGSRFVILSLKLGNLFDLGFADAFIAFLDFRNFDFEREMQNKLSEVLKIGRYLVHVSMTHVDKV